MEAKMDEPISHVQGWLNCWIAIAIARSYSRMICRARLYSPLKDTEPGAGLGPDIRPRVGALNRGIE